MTYTTLYRICGYSTVIGLVMLFALQALNIKTGWFVWLSSGLFCGGLFIAVIMVIPMMRSSQSAKGSALLELLVLSFKGDDSEFGSPELRDKIIALAARIEERVCDGETSCYDGDEYGGGEAMLYFNASSAIELFAAIQSNFQDDAEINSATVHRITEGGSRIRLRWDKQDA